MGPTGRLLHGVHDCLVEEGPHGPERPGEHVPEDAEYPPGAEPRPDLRLLERGPPAHALPVREELRPGLDELVPLAGPEGARDDARRQHCERGEAGGVAVVRRSVQDGGEEWAAARGGLAGP